MTEAKMFGFSIEAVENAGRFLMYAGFLFGAAAFITSSASAYLLYRTSNVMQAEASRQIAEWRAKTEQAIADTATANQRAASLSKEAEQERLERVRLEAEIAPRRLSQQQQVAVSRSLSKFSGQKISVASYALDTEAGVLAKQIIASSTAAGMKTADGTAAIMPLGGFALGVQVSGRNAPLVGAIQASLSEAGLAVTVQKSAPSMPNLSTGDARDVGSVEASVLVGAKPPTR